jgi:hypothetical protein
MDNPRDFYATEEAALNRVKTLMKQGTLLDEKVIDSVLPDDSLAHIYGVSDLNFRTLVELVETDLKAFLPPLPKPPFDTVQWLAESALKVRWS